MKNNTEQPTLKIISIIVLIFVTATSSVLFGYLIAIDTVPAEETEVNKDPEIDKFIKNYNYILDNYYEEINKEDLIKGAINGMLESLGDDFSSYLDEDANDNFQLQVRGTYEGVGISMNSDESGSIIVTGIFEDSPAEKAGFKVGDILIAIDGIDYTEKTSEDVVNYIRKSDRKDFAIEIKRDKETIEIPVSKGQIIIKSVESKTYDVEDKKIGYLYVSLFAANTYNQFREELTKLETSGIDGLIIDLRGNTGGYLSAVDSMTSLFMDGSHVLYQTEVKGDVEVFNSSGKTTKDYKIVVLGDGGSASASEIMIAALVESYGADFVGTSTYGKGTVQELINVSNDEAYKFTIKKWLTPEGTWINKVGYKPTHEVKLDAKYFETFEPSDDNQLQKALELLK